jgi:pyruvate kinase
MSELACDTAQKEGFGQAGQMIAISAGMPFGTSGTTNLLRIARIG